jgi:hypothetical protein
MSINYNLNVLFFELTLVRVCMSWLFVAMLGACFPNLIAMSESERKATFSAPNLGLKLSGTALVVAALVMMFLK